MTSMTSAGHIIIFGPYLDDWRLACLLTLSTKIMGNCINKSSYHPPLEQASDASSPGSVVNISARGSNAETPLIGRPASPNYSDVSSSVSIPTLSPRCAARDTRSPEPRRLSLSPRFLLALLSFLYSVTECCAVYSAAFSTCAIAGKFCTDRQVGRGAVHQRGGG